MNSQKTVKPKRHKKKKPRTEVSSDSESEPEQPETLTTDSPKGSKTNLKSKRMTDAEVSAAFNTFYMQRATVEFAEDLDKIRNADDFKDEAVPMLINALQQGTDVFSVEEKRRVVEAPKEESGKGS